MKEPIVLKSDDPIIQSLPFKPYRNIVQRHVAPFVPNEGEAQTMEVITPWGSKLIVNKGDLLISELNNPKDVWPISAEIFAQTYMMIAPDICIKRAITWLAPLEEVVNGDQNQQVAVYTLEGVEIVRAGDFYLAKGIQGEIWPYPKEKAAETMRPAE